MRLALFLIVLIETAWIGHTLGRVADHYEYLDGTYRSAMTRCNVALDYCQLKRKDSK